MEIITIFNIIIIIFIAFFVPLNEFFTAPIIKKIIQPVQYEKLFKNYALTIKLNKINKEFLINNINIPQDYLIDFLYKGQFLHLNDELLKIYTIEDYKDKILLIRNNNTFTNYIIKNKPIIQELTKVIILPNNTIPNFNYIAKYCYDEYSLLVIELEDNIFNTLEEFGEYNNIEIISKKFDILPYKFLIINLVIIMILNIIFSLLYSLLLSISNNKLNNNLKSFYNNIRIQMNFKFVTALFLCAELFSLYNKKFIYIKFMFFWRGFAKLLQIINRFTLFCFDDTYLGLGINITSEKINSYIIFYIFYYIYLSIIDSPLRVPRTIYITIFLLSPIYCEMVSSSIKNIIYLIKINSKICKNRRQYMIYGPGVILKILIVIVQLAILFFVSYIYLCIHKYFFLKKELNFVLEEDILVQCLENYFLLLIAIIYIPKKMPAGFWLYILTIKDSKKTKKIQISTEDKYFSSINKKILDNERKIRTYVESNDDKDFIILNPSIFFFKNRNNNIIKEQQEESFILGNNIKLGKLNNIHF